MSEPNDGRIPITIVTGFLGSGKTTIIRHLLADHRYANAAVIVNELGETGIDHHLFRQTDERITLLREGCACCARRDDLVEALVDLVRRFDRGVLPSFDRVLLETSGLADPAPILHTITVDPILHRRFRVVLTVATLDAVAGETNLTKHGEAVRQVAAADLILLTKSDLATPETTARLSCLAGKLNPAASVIAADRGRIDPDCFCSGHVAEKRDVSPGEVREDIPALIHGGQTRVAALSLRYDSAVDWRMLGLWLTMLLRCHGEKILRVKGILDVGENGPLLLEGVQHVVHAPRHLHDWPDADRCSRLVIIARDIDPELIRESFETFQALAGNHS